MRVWLLVPVAILLVALPSAQAADGEWSGALGLSYNSTTGNSSTSSMGLDFGLKLQPNPWGAEFALSWLRSESDGATTADRLTGRARAQREVDQYWLVFAGLSGEKDEFAGYDLRAFLEVGATYKILLGPKHELSADGGLARTHENQVDPPEGTGEDLDYWGGLLGISYAWHFSATGALTERAVLYPNFDDSSNWRLISDTAVQAKISDKLALKIAYQYKFANQPPAGKDSTDTTTTASVVWSF